jgi:hypothetical protein
VLDSIEKELRAIKTASTIEATGYVTSVDEHWSRTFFSWLDETLTTWSRHVEQMLPQKTVAAVETEVRALNGHLAAPYAPQPPTPSTLTPSPSRLELPPLRDASEVPTVFEAFFELFKGGLNTAAMLAGLVIVPVVGSLSHEQPVALRATVMSGFIVPIVGFAVFQTRRIRRRMMDKGAEKSAAKLKKDVEAFCKTKVERFKGEIERFAHAYVATAQNEIVAGAESAVTRTFAKKEEALAGDLAKAQLTADKLADQINAYKSVRGALSGTFLVEAKRKLRDLEAA